MRIAIIALAAILPAAAAAAPAPPLSWGKPGVSLATYRAESIDCATRAYYTDVAGTEGAQNFVRGSRELETLVDNRAQDMISMATSYGNIEHSVRPEESLKDVKQFQYGLLAKCLSDHGYLRFRLTDDQRKHLGKLKAGSDARHDYLYRLASDPAILAAQAAPDPARPPQP
jgi:hypothetical protein